MSGRFPPPFGLQNLPADVHAARCEDWLLLIVGLYFQFLSHRPRKRCLVFTSQRFTGVTKDAASARPSRPVRALRTAVATRKPSGSVLGKKNCRACVCNYRTSWTTSSVAWFHLHALFLALRLSEDRVGDICNACVLLVKRWKKLPSGSKKNWNHVSDIQVERVTIVLPQLDLNWHPSHLESGGGCQSWARI